MTTDTSPSPSSVDDFAHRLLNAARSWRDGAYAPLWNELRNQPDHGFALLMALADNKSERVRDWAAVAARRELGRAGLPVLLKLANHPRTFTRDGAMQELEALDIELLRPFARDMRRTVLRSTTLYSEGGAAMWRLARLGDVESAATFRRFAAKHDPRHYDAKMPTVLADYLDDPSSIERRIASHDHDAMPCLAKAAALIPIPTAERVLVAASVELPDQECRAVCETELRGILGRSEGM